jgi:hypothetical protein
MSDDVVILQTVISLIDLEGSTKYLKGYKLIVLKMDCLPFSVQ